MYRRLPARRSLALGAAVLVGTWGAAAVPAAADPGSGKSGQHAQARGGHKAKHTGVGRSRAGTGQGHSRGQSGKGHVSRGAGSNAGGNAGSHAGSSARTHAGGHGDPAGNNGTVKIAPLGEVDGIPNNSPHPGCTFQVEWYGFDQGADIISSVSFVMQAPTADVALTVAGDPTVFVGGDPASGAGTDTGLDGTEAYTLSFDGAPHPQQGYHVKLTVSTPRSNGNDTKSKVFWVEPCEAPTARSGGSTDDSTDDENATPPGSTKSGSTQHGSGQHGSGQHGSGQHATSASSHHEVLSARASGGKGGTASASTGAGVPTAVDAGENAALDWVRSPLPLLVIALGALLAAAAFVTRRRNSVPAGE